MRYLRQINKISEEIESQLRISMRNDDILRLMELRKGLTYFSSGLRSNQSVFEKIWSFGNNHTGEGVIGFFKEEKLLFEDFIIENNQALETVEMYSQILTQLADIFSSVISNNQNTVMEFLAAITIMFAIPTVIAGFFGMNVPVPMESNSYGFIIIMVIATIAAGFSMYIFYKKRMT